VRRTADRGRIRIIEKQVLGCRPLLLFFFFSEHGGFFISYEQLGGGTVTQVFPCPVSEVLFLCEQHSIDAVIIAPEVEHGEIVEKQLRGTVMRLKSNADAA
jgi:hypothetical protein